MMPIFGCSKCSTLMAGPEHTDKAVCGKCQMKAAVQQKFDEMERKIEALEAENRALHELADSVRLLYQALGNTLRHGADPKPTASEGEAANE